MPAPRIVHFHFDILCPWAFQTSLWMRNVRDQTGVEVKWKFFSLEEINHVEGKKHPWERDWSYGWSLLRIAALLRRRDEDLVDRWYLRAGTALHAEGRKPHDPEVARELLADLDLDPGLVDEALADATTHDDVKADHDEARELNTFGVPTLIFPEHNQALFGPVVINPPTGDEALKLWDLVTTHLEFPNFFELKRPKSAVHAAAILEAFSPYLTARDWQTIEDGRVIPIPIPLPQS